MLIKRLFTEHPASIGETYFEHMAVAASFALRLIVAGGACFVHALVPALCVTSGSDAVRRLHARMAPRRGSPGERQVLPGQQAPRDSAVRP